LAVSFESVDPADAASDEDFDVVPPVDSDRVSLLECDAEDFRLSLMYQPDPLKITPAG
jgi:hypothetical protein